MREAGLAARILIEACGDITTLFSRTARRDTATGAGDRPIASVAVRLGFVPPTANAGDGGVNALTFRPRHRLARTSGAHF